jgi:diguanylate cyclase (GGDEF)-like protein/PAS domain S-box-containing protein
MNINLLSSKKLNILFVSETPFHEIKKLFSQFYELLDIAKDVKSAKKYFNDFYKKHHYYYDIVIIHHHNNTTFSFLQEIRKQHQTQLIAFIVNETNTGAIKKAIRLQVDSIILTPLRSVNELITPIVKLISIRNTENNLRISNYLIEQKDKIIDENIYMSVSDLDGKIIHISKAYSDFTGYSKEELIGRNHKIFRHPHASREVIKELWETITKGKVWKGELKNIKKNGQTFVVNSTITSLKDPDGKKIGYLNIINDITEIKRLEELSITDPLTRIYNRRYFDFMLQKEFKNAQWKKTNFSLCILDVDNFKNYNDYYGHSKGDEALKQIAQVLLHYQRTFLDYVFRIGGEEFALMVRGKSDEEIALHINNLLKDIENLHIEHAKNSASKYVTASVGIVNISNFNQVFSYEDVYNIADANLYKAKKQGRNQAVIETNFENIIHVKDTDTITKLPNRTVLLNDLSILQNEAMLIILHINQIKVLKEIYGADIVIDILQSKTKTLQETINDQDVTLYSLNSQEFALLITNQSLFNKYLELVKYSILTEDAIHASNSSSDIITSFTAGIAYGVINIFNYADIALQEALISNQKYVIYNANHPFKEIQENKIKRLKIYKEALLNNNIIPYFQPIVSVKEHTIQKYEALARLQTATGEIISPYFFLDSAVLDKTYEFFSRQMMQKVFNIYSKNNAEISINVNYQNIISNSMTSYIQNRLEKYGGERITFEIVETEEIQDYEKVEAFILMVKKYGAKVSIDDFGSGYSNFTNIIKLNIDYIKLDGSLTKQLLDDKNVENMVKAIISFAKEANIKTIAEFVSTKALDAKVKELGVDYIQGYLYGEPKDPKQYGLKV